VLGTQETFCIVIAGLLERDSFDLFLPEFDKPWVIHLRETCCCSTNLCTWRPNTVYKNRRVRRHQHAPHRQWNMPKKTLDRSSRTSLLYPNLVPLVPLPSVLFPAIQRRPHDIEATGGEDAAGCCPGRPSRVEPVVRGWIPRARGQSYDDLGILCHATVRNPNPTSQL
jgi:hypothetical protein